MAERETEEEQDREIERLKELAQRLGGTEAAIEGSSDSAEHTSQPSAPRSAERPELGKAPTEPS